MLNLTCTLAAKYWQLGINLACVPQPDLEHATFSDDDVSSCCASRARGVVASHPLSMREALGSIPSVSNCAAWSDGRHYPGAASGPRAKGARTWHVKKTQPPFAGLHASDNDPGQGHFPASDVPAAISGGPGRSHWHAQGGSYLRLCTKSVRNGPKAPDAG